jgi:pyrroloquinoline quinone biosynthesis protein D
MALDPQLPLTFSLLHRLQWEEAQQKHVILYPEGMVELNATAAEILTLCDGTRTLNDIVDHLERKFETTGLKDDICEMLEASLANGWIRQLARQ